MCADTQRCSSTAIHCGDLRPRPSTLSPSQPTSGRDLSLIVTDRTQSFQGVQTTFHKPVAFVALPVNPAPTPLERSTPVATKSLPTSSHCSPASAVAPPQAAQADDSTPPSIQHTRRAARFVDHDPSALRAAARRHESRLGSQPGSCSRGASPDQAELHSRGKKVSSRSQGKRRARSTRGQASGAALLLRGKTTAPAAKGDRGGSVVASALRSTEPLACQAAPATRCPPDSLILRRGGQVDSSSVAATASLPRSVAAARAAAQVQDGVMAKVGGRTSHSAAARRGNDRRSEGSSAGGELRCSAESPVPALGSTTLRGDCSAELVYGQRSSSDAMVMDPLGNEEHSSTSTWVDDWVLTSEATECPAPPSEELQSHAVRDFPFSIFISLACLQSTVLWSVCPCV
jgi:hypothetical protein